MRELDVFVQDFIDLKPYGFHAELDRQGSSEVAIAGDVYHRFHHRVVLRGRVFHPVPVVELGSLIGELVHDLRSALDHLVWELVLAEEAEAPPFPIPRDSSWLGVGFPICFSPESWESSWKRRIWGIHPQAELFRALQPYVTGPNDPVREPLAVLHNLWNIDKHRAAPVVGSVLSISGVGTIPPAIDLPLIKTRLVQPHFGPFEEDDVLAEVDMTTSGLIGRAFAQDYLDHYLGRSFGVAFGDGPPAYGAEVRDVGGRMYEAVRSILDGFEPA
ncbi:MAG: hypothetical protein WEF05_03005 [Actinomycetota bacterium]